jgi:anti-sigma B factor antagonist
MSERVSKLKIAQRQVDDVVVVALSGELTLDDGDIAFGKCVDELIKSGQVKLIINLSEVTYIDSAGVGMMVAENKSVRQHGGVMKLASLSARSHHLLAMLKLKIVFDVFEDEASALKSFAWGMRE